ncbi:MAG: GGDEF domain-containing protein [Syntrophales bacterium]|nr:GGDEF domain-containing protein [Syntrophales bacterium]MCK9392305.1 GGDEF domain-containing protein [Syntrophales bacterium]
MKHSESEVRLLGRMANLVLSCLTQEEARVVAARFLPQLFPGETGALFVRHSAQDIYDPIVFWGEERQWQSFSGQDCWSLRRRRIHIVREDKDQPPCPHADHDPERWISLCIPMTAREDILGVFHLLVPVRAVGSRQGGEGEWADGQDGRREGARTDSGDTLAGKRRLAALAADLLTLLLVNLRLRKQIDDLSVRDALTGCFNRRYLEETLARELKSSQRTGRQLAVILMDIDHFGQFTEVFGHGASGLVLRDLGNFLRENIRDVDVPCRYGADEFALLLPDTSLATCRLRAEHLHAMIRDLSLQDGHAHMRRITLSIGIAAYPDQGETMCDLMEAVKTALKNAKQTGRDRISMAEE